MTDYAEVLIAYPAMASYYVDIFRKLKIPTEILSTNNVGSMTMVDKLQHAKLVIFTGGEDISPAFYGQMPTYSYGINRRRDEIEQTIYKHTLSYSHAKILGVCRGHQLVLALNGFPLYQDITFDKKVTHNYVHPLESVNAKSMVRFFAKASVNSMHHQSVVEWKGSVRGLKITSMHQEIVESVESNRILTTQFHPEVMASRNEDMKSPVWKFWAEVAEWMKNPEPEPVKKVPEPSGIRYTISSSSTSTLSSNPRRIASVDGLEVVDFSPLHVDPRIFEHEMDYIGQTEEEIEEILRQQRENHEDEIWEESEEIEDEE